MVNEVIEKINDKINENCNFLLDAGAGSGKTYTLIETIKNILNIKSKKNQKILCITFTNIAKEEIIKRISSLKNAEKILINTIHDFFWSFINQFQIELRKQVKILSEEYIDKLNNEIKEAKRKLDNPKHNTNIEKQKQLIQNNTVRLSKYEGIDYSKLKIKYLNYRALYRGIISHDDILKITKVFIENDFFFNLFAEVYPFVLIDEYQDTDSGILEILINKSYDFKVHRKTKFILGLFGDSMQQIYENNNCIVDFEEPKIYKIYKLDNFRTCEEIVLTNNILRGDNLVQNCEIQNPKVEFKKLEFIYNTNEDKDLKKYFSKDDSFNNYYRLHLSNRCIAEEVGFPTISMVFSKRYNKDSNEKLLKMEDPLIYYIQKNVTILVNEFRSGNYRNIIRKLKYDTLLELENISIDIKEILMNDELSIKELIEKFLELNIIKNTDITNLLDSYDGESDSEFVENLTKIKLSEFISLSTQVSGNTMLRTMHGVKGDEFENVIVNLVKDQPWNKYNFDNLIRFNNNSLGVSFQSRKLLYVACTRAKKSLIINYIVPSNEINTNQEEIRIKIKEIFGDKIVFTTY